MRAPSAFARNAAAKVVALMFGSRHVQFVRKPVPIDRIQKLLARRRMSASALRDRITRSGAGRVEVDDEPEPPQKCAIEIALAIRRENGDLLELLHALQQIVDRMSA